MSDSRRADALALAEELLSDIELARLGSTEIVRKASRLARLTDDSEAMEWLAYEIIGYGDGTLTEGGMRAATLSARYAPPRTGESRRCSSACG